MSIYPQSSRQPSADGPAPRSTDESRKRAFVTPALTSEGSVPRITCGSDIFGDNRP